MKGAEQVRVFLNGRQVDAAGEESRIALSVTGRRFLRGESHYVSYDDATLIVRWTQHFAAGEERSSNYRTPYGTFLIKTDTRRLRMRTFPDGREEIYIFYTLYVDGVRQSDNMLEIRIESM